MGDSDKSGEGVGPVVVLTMGRVGSSSVSRSIQAALGSDVHHVHSIDPITLARQVAENGSIESSAKSVRAGLSLSRQMVGSGSRARIITMVREPMARNVSAAFTSLRKATPPAELQALVASPKDVLKYWGRFYDRRPFTWFTREIVGVLGIDVFERAFPDSGFQVWPDGRHDLLILKSEAPRSIQTQALQQFLRRSDIQIHDVNILNRGLSAYQTFKTNLRFTEAYVKECWESEYRRHFYPEIELEAYLKEWVSH